MRSGSPEGRTALAPHPDVRRSARLPLAPGRSAHLSRPAAVEELAPACGRDLDVVAARGRPDPLPGLLSFRMLTCSTWSKRAMALRTWRASTSGTLRSLGKANASRAAVLLTRRHPRRVGTLLPRRRAACADLAFSRFRRAASFWRSVAMTVLYAFGGDGLLQPGSEQDVRSPAGPPGPRGTAGWCAPGAVSGRPRGASPASVDVLASHGRRRLWVPPRRSGRRVGRAR
jgi:hypothetical protein